MDADVGGGGGVLRVAARGTRSSELVDFSSSAWIFLTGFEAEEVVATDADL